MCIFYKCNCKVNKRQQQKDQVNGTNEEINMAFVDRKY